MKEERRQSRFANLGLLIVSLGLALVLSEWFVRSFARQPVHAGRRLFTSSPQFAVTPGGALHYIANDTVRMVAVYQGVVEYDVVFTTNNMGFVDTKDYPLAVSRRYPTRYVIVGNSFAAGIHGGEAWVPRLRAGAAVEGDEPVMYNLGVEGTGLWHFIKLLTHAEKALSFDVIVVIVISDDFRRPYWRPLVAESTVFLCPTSDSEAECKSRRKYATLFDAETPLDSIVGLARAQSGGGLMLHDPMRLVSDLAKRSQVLVLLVREFRAMTGMRSKASFAGIRALVERQPDKVIYLMHVPQRHELVNGRYDVHASELSADLGIRYVPLMGLCEWDVGMFYERDSHPKQRGYDALRRCVAKALELPQE